MTITAETKQLDNGRYHVDFFTMTITAETIQLDNGRYHVDMIFTMTITAETRQLATFHPKKSFLLQYAFNAIAKYLETHFHCLLLHQVNLEN